MRIADYRSKAEEMRKLARGAPDALLQAEYLKLAQGWDDLAASAAEQGDEPPQTPE
jgi:hypothetical protein